MSLLARWTGKLVGGPPAGRSNIQSESIPAVLDLIYPQINVQRIVLDQNQFPNKNVAEKNKFISNSRVG